MLFPTGTEQYNHKFAWATWLLIAINVAVFWWELQLPPGRIRAVYMDMLVVPANIIANPLSPESFFDIMRSTFMHAGFGHITGNMLFLLLFGANVERKLGSLLFLFVYLVAGITAALMHVIFFPAKQIPLLGASGAIAGMMGMYLVLFPRSKIKGLFPVGAFFAPFLYPLLYPIFGELTSLLYFVVWYTRWPVWIFLGIILFRDVSGAMESLQYVQAGGGVAHFGHLGGFLPGMFFGLMARLAMWSNPKKAWQKRLLY